MGDWIKDNKGTGPWPFTPQPDKPHYNEGTLFSNPGGSWINPNQNVGNTPITPNEHDPWCGYWTRNYVSPGGGGGGGGGGAVNIGFYQAAADPDSSTHFFDGTSWQEIFPATDSVDTADAMSDMDMHSSGLAVIAECTSDYKCYVKVSTDYGATWAAKKLIDSDTWLLYSDCRIDSDGNIWVLVYHWQGAAYPDDVINLWKSTDQGATFTKVGTTSITSLSGITHVDMAVTKNGSATDVYVTWPDDNATVGAHVAKFAGGTTYSHIGTYAVAGHSMTKFAKIAANGADWILATCITATPWPILYIFKNGTAEYNGLQIRGSAEPYSRLRNYGDTLIWSGVTTTQSVNTNQQPTTATEKNSVVISLDGGSTWTVFDGPVSQQLPFNGAMLMASVYQSKILLATIRDSEVVGGQYEFFLHTAPVPSPGDSIITWTQIHYEANMSFTPNTNDLGAAGIAIH